MVRVTINDEELSSIDFEDGKGYVINPDNNNLSVLNIKKDMFATFTDSAWAWVEVDSK